MNNDRLNDLGEANDDEGDLDAIRIKERQEWVSRPDYNKSRHIGLSKEEVAERVAKGTLRIFKV